MRREACFPGLGRDGRRDNGRAVPVSGVILDNENRSDAALLAADNRTEIGIKNISTFYAVIHKGSLSAVQSHRRTEVKFCPAVTMIFPRGGGIYTPSFPQTHGKGRHPPHNRPTLPRFILRAGWGKGVSVFWGAFGVEFSSKINPRHARTDVAKQLVGDGLREACRVFYGGVGAVDFDFVPHLGVRTVSDIGHAHIHADPA